MSSVTAAKYDIYPHPFLHSSPYHPLEYSFESLLATLLLFVKGSNYIIPLGMSVLIFVGPFTVSAMPEMFRFSSVGKDLDGCSSKIMHPDKDGFGDVSNSKS